MTTAARRTPEDTGSLHHMDSSPGCRFQKSTAQNAPSHLRIIFVFVWKPPKRVVSTVPIPFIPLWTIFVRGRR